MARNLENRSISFDPDIFDAMEDRRQKMFMSRSEFVQRCVMKFLVGDRKMEVEEVSNSVITRTHVPYSRQPVKAGKK